MRFVYSFSETNSKFAPENDLNGWFGDNPFSLGFCLFSGIYVRFRYIYIYLKLVQMILSFFGGKLDLYFRGVLVRFQGGHSL